MTKIQNKKVLAVGCHPDDIEIMCAGTLALLKDYNWSVTISTMTAGDCGSATLSKEEISEIRKKEALTSAKILNANYYCMENEDIFVLYDRPTLLKAIDLVRKVKPDIVITHSPVDYMVDHETTSRIIKTACFSAGIQNIKTETEPYMKIPYLYYMDPLEGIDDLGQRINPTTLVDITSKINIKEKMLSTHKSQRDWLMSHNGIDEYTIAMKEFSALRGKEYGSQFAEGFRQHLGHAYPKSNILKEVLSDFTKII